MTDTQRALGRDTQHYPKVDLPDPPDREYGKVRWFDVERRFGFIRRDATGDDIFVHLTAVKRAGRDTLEPDEVVSFQAAPASESDPRQMATDLRFPDNTEARNG